MTAKPRLTDVLDTIGTAIAVAINSAGITTPCQVGPGTVVSTQIAEILAQGAGNSVVALWPLPANNDERFSPIDGAITVMPVPTLVASVSAEVITFSGIPEVCNVHTVINHAADALVVPAVGQTLAQVAANVASAVNALALPGVSASASGAQVTFSGAFDLFCNVGVDGTYTQEVMRISRGVQATVYSPDPLTRTTIADAIISLVGTALVHWYTLSDGQPLYVRFNMRAGDKLEERAQASYSAYEECIVFETQYPITVTSIVTPVGVVELVSANNAPVTSYIGG